jgi:putative ABC transport system substrate-binding protein
MRLAALRKGLRELGWNDGQNVRFDYRFYTTLDAAGVRSLAAQLAALAPDLLVAITGNSVTALRNTTRTIPILFVQIPDPVSNGHVASLARPGGNVTGFSSFEYEAGGKWLEVLKEASPRTEHVAVIANKADVSLPGFLRVLRSAASTLHLRLATAEADSPADIEEAVNVLAKEPNGGLVALPNPVATQNVELITGLAARLRIPAVFPYRYFVTRGGLMSYGIDNYDLFRRASGYIDRIFKGENPGDLPVQQPTKYELVINLTVAKALGLVISRDMLLIADEVIE